MNCEIGSGAIYIRKFSYDTNRIKIIRCCHRESEIIHEMTYDDIFKMSAAEFMQFLYDLYKIIPSNHDYKTYYYCKTKEKICNYCDSYFNEIYVDILTHCNLKCSFCHIHQHFIKTDEDIKLYFDILNKLRNNHLKILNLTCNGEPFYFKKDIFNYLESLTSDDFEVVKIISNLTLLNFNDIVHLYNIQKKNNIKIQIIASCSGITEETYKIMHNNNLFNKVVPNIRLLNYFGLLCAINFVIAPENLCELPNLKSFWANNGVHDYQVVGSVIIDNHDEYRIKNATNIVLDSIEYKNFIQQLNR